MINPFADTQLSVGKYITDSLLFKYSVNVKENTDVAKLYYEQQFGFEWRIFSSLNFEWMYFPDYYDEQEVSNPQEEHRVELEWKRKVSF